MEQIEFACDIKLIKDVVNTFKKDVKVTKLNAYIILVKMDIQYEEEFINWAKVKSDSYLITIVEPARLRDKLPQ